MKSIEADLLKTAAKEVKGSMKAIVGRTAANMLAFNYNDRDEKRLRDKLVSKLKQKEVDKMEHFGERLKNAKEGIYDDSMEDISDDDLEVSQPSAE